MPSKGEPAWVRSPPAAYDIVTAYYPESQGGTRSAKPKLRPSLVLNVLTDPDEPGLFFCRVAYGTKNLKIVQRRHLDIIVQNAVHVHQLGLARATRFDLDSTVTLPWTDEFFGCWTGHATPRIGALTEDYIREYAYLMMLRHTPSGDG